MTPELRRQRRIASALARVARALARWQRKRGERSREATVLRDAVTTLGSILGPDRDGSSPAATVHRVIAPSLERMLAAPDRPARVSAAPRARTLAHHGVSAKRREQQ